MSISTTAAKANLSSSASHPAIFYPGWLLLPGFAIGLAVSRSPRRCRSRVLGWIALLLLPLLTFVLLSCGGVSSGGGGTCSSIPSVPSGLGASATTTSGTTLTWTASAVTAGCTATDVVYENGAQLTTSANPSLAVTGLTAATTYSFAVAAKDSFGASAQSPPINVTTLPGSTYTITVTGTSPGTTPDAGQSVQVILVVN